ncbi:MAG TPA: NAD(P)H-dependent oxidoreductase subunit E, partial [Gemmatimonadaceae bacterium]|nr:NAD(P)H-dependent oxidoreductase subunit E [Gemmatimonadaceae bacterium]
MDLHLHEAEPTPDERDAIDTLLGAPTSGWDGGERDPVRDTHVGFGGGAARSRRHLLLPALHAAQSRVGWISEGALNHICTRLSVPPAEAWGVATFYALFSTTPRPKRVLHVCDDIACKCRGADELIAKLEQEVGPAHHAPHGREVEVGGFAWVRSPCLGMCEQAPAALLQEFGKKPKDELISGAESVLGAARALQETRGGQYSALGSAENRTAAASTLAAAGRGPTTVTSAAENLLTRRIGVVDPSSLDAYRKADGYKALAIALDMGADAVIAEVTAAKLLGRGGAAFPTGRKWDAVAKQPAMPHYLVCNADESEPGTFKDRILMEGDPFAIVEAMTIAGIATRCERGFFYVRGEYPLALARMTSAIEQARKAGLLGANIMGRG